MNYFSSVILTARKVHFVNDMIALTEFCVKITLYSPFLDPGLELGVLDLNGLLNGIPKFRRTSMDCGGKVHENVRFSRFFPDVCLTIFFLYSC